MIYSFARSLDVNLVFENRPYTLGEIIKVTVELNARRDVKVRKGRVVLVYEVRWTAADTELRPNGRMTRPGPGGRIITSSTFRVPTQKQVEHRYFYVLGSVSFLEHTRLQPHTNVSYNIELQIHKDDPPYAFVKGASMVWSLVAVLDVALALDVKIRRDVNVTVAPLVWE